jgi:Common central domain of tyrosinase
MNRRTFIARSFGTTALALTHSLWPRGIVLAQNGGPLVRLRLEDFVMEPNRIAALRRGVAEMKKRKPSDPTSWFFQAAVHGVSDDAIAKAQEEDPEVMNVERDKFWNQCPHQERDGTGGADFLVWHRAYLFYFERILRAASGDPALTVPYWNYTDEGQRLFPTQFGEQEFEGANGTEPNPLFDARRENVFTLGFYELTDSAVSAERALAAKTFFDDTSGRGIAGDPTAGAGVSQGLIERRPHNLLHFAIGGFIATTPDGSEGTAGLMGEVETAAFDPIFWVHHSNIDRLWNVWDATPGKEWGTVASPEWFEAKPWWFYDADKTVKNETRAFYTAAKNLGFAYDSDQPNVPRLSASIPTQAGPLLTGEQPPKTPLVTEIAISKDGLVIKGASPASVVLSLKPESPSDQIGLTASLRAASLSGEAPRVLLTFSDLKQKPGEAMAYDVFLNPPKGKFDRNHRSFAGTLALFGLEHAHAKKHHAGGASDTLDITEIVRGLEADPDSIEVKIAPAPLLKESKKAGERLVRPREATLSVGSVEITVLKA